MEKVRSSPWVRVLATLMVAYLLPLLGGSIGINLLCEDLLSEECAFAVSSAGARCVLEKVPDGTGQLQAQCQTSSIMAEKHIEWIETDECLQACGLQRLTFGMSTDALLENDFTSKLCSSNCQDNCPNVVQLHLELAADEGLYLPDLCMSLENDSEQVHVDTVTSWTGPESQTQKEADSWPEPSVEKAWTGQWEGMVQIGAPGPQPSGAIQSQWEPAASPVPWEAAPGRNPEAAPGPMTLGGWTLHNHA